MVYIARWNHAPPENHFSSCLQGLLSSPYSLINKKDYLLDSHRTVLKAQQSLQIWPGPRPHIPLLWGTGNHGEHLLYVYGKDLTKIWTLAGYDSPQASSIIREPCHPALVPLSGLPFSPISTIQSGCLGLLSKPVRLSYTLCTLISASMWYLFCVSSARKMHELLGTGTKTAMLFPVSYQLQVFLFIWLIYTSPSSRWKVLIFLLWEVKYDIIILHIQLTTSRKRKELQPCI